MLSRIAVAAVAICLLLAGQIATAQQQAALTPWRAVDANGMALAQTDIAIEQLRLRQQSTPPVSYGVDANGTAIAEVEPSSSDDDSFGAQRIMKQQEKRRAFTLSGGASFIYTDNVGLTRRGTIDDIFLVANAGIAWSHPLPHNVELNASAYVSMFRYDKMSDLDFQNIGVGIGVTWTPPVLRGASLFARYDFTELWSAGGDQVLMDHVLTAGVQKAFSFGRAHGLTIGAIGSLGFSDPSDAQRHQLGAFLSYRLQLTRQLETDFLYRPAVHFYDDAGRTDFNQIVSWHLRYRFNEWAELNAFLSYGFNRSDRASFDYDVLTTGGGAAVVIRF